MSGTISMSSDDAVPQRVLHGIVSTEARLKPGLLGSFKKGLHWENSAVYVCFVPLPAKLILHPEVSLVLIPN